MEPEPSVAGEAYFSTNGGQWAPQPFTRTAVIVRGDVEDIGEEDEFVARLREQFPAKCKAISRVVAHPHEIYDYFDGLAVARYGLGYLRAVISQLFWDNLRRLRNIEKFIDQWRQKNESLFWSLEENASVDQAFHQQDIDKYGLEYVQDALERMWFVRDREAEYVQATRSQLSDRGNFHSDPEQYVRDQVNEDMLRNVANATQKALTSRVISGNPSSQIQSHISVPRSGTIDYYPGELPPQPRPRRLPTPMVVSNDARVLESLEASSRQQGSSGRRKAERQLSLASGNVNVGLSSIQEIPKSPFEEEHHAQHTQQLNQNIDQPFYQTPFYVDQGRAPSSVSTAPGPAVPLSDRLGVAHSQLVVHRARPPLVSPMSRNPALTPLITPATARADPHSQTSQGRPIYYSSSHPVSSFLPYPSPNGDTGPPRRLMSNSHNQHGFSRPGITQYTAQKPDSSRRNSADHKPPNFYKLFVGNLLQSDSLELMEALFKPWGHDDIAPIRLNDKVNRPYPGYTFVRFATIEQAAAAMRSLDHRPCALLDGRELHISYARMRDRDQALQRFEPSSPKHGELGGALGPPSAGLSRSGGNEIEQLRIGRADDAGEFPLRRETDSPGPKSGNDALEQEPATRVSGEETPESGLSCLSHESSIIPKAHVQAFNSSEETNIFQPGHNASLKPVVVYRSAKTFNSQEDGINAHGPQQLSDSSYAVTQVSNDTGNPAYNRAPANAKESEEAFGSAPESSIKTNKKSHARKGKSKARIPTEGSKRKPAQPTKDADRTSEIKETTSPALIQKAKANNSKQAVKKTDNQRKSSNVQWDKNEAEAAVVTSNRSATVEEPADELSSRQDKCTMAITGPISQEISRGESSSSQDLILLVAHDVISTQPTTFTPSEASDTEFEAARKKPAVSPDDLHNMETRIHSTNFEKSAQGLADQSKPLERGTVEDSIDDSKVRLPSQGPKQSFSKAVPFITPAVPDFNRMRQLHRREQQLRQPRQQLPETGECIMTEELCDDSIIAELDSISIQDPDKTCEGLVIEEVGHVSKRDIEDVERQLNSIADEAEELSKHGETVVAVDHVSSERRHSKSTLGAKTPTSSNEDLDKHGEAHDHELSQSRSNFLLQNEQPESIPVRQVSSVHYDIDQNRNLTVVPNAATSDVKPVITHKKKKKRQTSRSREIIGSEESQASDNPSPSHVAVKPAQFNESSRLPETSGSDKGASADIVSANPEAAHSTLSDKPALTDPSLDYGGHEGKIHASNGESKDGPSAHAAFEHQEERADSKKESGSDTASEVDDRDSLPVSSATRTPVSSVKKKKKKNRKSKKRKTHGSKVNVQQDGVAESSGTVEASVSETPTPRRPLPAPETFHWRMNPNDVALSPPGLAQQNKSIRPAGSKESQEHKNFVDRPWSELIDDYYEQKRSQYEPELPPDMVPSRPPSVNSNTELGDDNGSVSVTAGKPKRTSFERKRELRHALIDCGYHEREVDGEDAAMEGDDELSDGSSREAEDKPLTNSMFSRREYSSLLHLYNAACSAIVRDPKPSQERRAILDDLPVSIVKDYEDSNGETTHVTALTALFDRNLNVRIDRLRELDKIIKAQKEKEEEEDRPQLRQTSPPADVEGTVDMTVKLHSGNRPCPKIGERDESAVQPRTALRKENQPPAANLAPTETVASPDGYTGKTFARVKHADGSEERIAILEAGGRSPYGGPDKDKVPENGKAGPPPKSEKGHTFKLMHDESKISTLPPAISPLQSMYHTKEAKEESWVTAAGSMVNFYRNGRIYNRVQGSNNEYRADYKFREGDTPWIDVVDHCISHVSRGDGEIVWTRKGYNMIPTYKGRQRQITEDRLPFLSEIPPLEEGDIVHVNRKSGSQWDEVIPPGAKALQNYFKNGVIYTKVPNTKNLYIVSYKLKMNDELVVNCEDRCFDLVISNNEIVWEREGFAEYYGKRRKFVPWKLPQSEEFNLGDFVEVRKQEKEEKVRQTPFRERLPEPLESFLPRYMRGRRMHGWRMGKSLWGVSSSEPAWGSGP